MSLESLYKRVVTDKTGENVGYVVGMSPTGASQAIVVAVESNGSNKTVGVPALTLIGVDSKKNLQINLPRETIVTSPTYANIGGLWQWRNRAR